MYTQQPHCLSHAPTACRRVTCPCPIAVRVHQMSLHARQIPLSRGRHAGGWFSDSPKKPLLQYESQLERRAIAALVGLKSCVAIETQPFTVHFEFRGQPRRYTPDLMVQIDHPSPTLVELGFMQQTVVEVKPDSLVGELRSYCVQRAAVRASTGLRLIMLGEQAIELLEWEVRHGQW